MTGSDVINVLKGGSVGLCPPGAKAFLLVTDNRRSWLDSPFCVITQHRKFAFGHHRQSRKISNAQELTMQPSQTLSSAIAQIKVSNSSITNHTKKILPWRPPPFILYILSPHYSLISNYFAYYSLISIKTGHYSLINKPHPDPHKGIRNVIDLLDTDGK